MFKDKAIIFINNKLIGGPQAFVDLATKEYDFVNFRPLPLLETLAEQAYKDYLNFEHVSISLRLFK